MKILFTKGPSKKKKYSLYEGVIKIGRSNTNNIMLTDSHCSREHITIVQRDEVLSITNHQLHNPVFVNGHQISAKTRIIAGDIVSFGHTEFLVYGNDQDPHSMIKPSKKRKDVSSAIGALLSNDLKKIGASNPTVRISPEIQPIDDSLIEQSCKPTIRISPGVKPVKHSAMDRPRQPRERIIPGAMAKKKAIIDSDNKPTIRIKPDMLSR